MNTTDTQHDSRPFGFWLKAVDRLMAAEFARVFEAEGATRRDWRLLNVVDGTAPGRRPLHPHKLEGLIARGWVAQDGADWTLTDEGRAAKERLGAAASGIRATVTDAVSPEEFATTLASLEKIARALGWDEETPLPRGRGRRHGFGRGFGGGFGGRHGHPFGRGFGPGFRPGFARHGGHGFGPDAGHGFAHGAGPDFEHGAPHGCGHERGHRFGHASDAEHSHGHGHGRHAGHREARAARHAFERGFDAGFSRGRDA